MPHDEFLSERFRDALGIRDDIRTIRMMGGECFMLNGNMLGGAKREKDGNGRFMFRVGPEQADAALKRPGARPMEMRGRRMNGFIFVEADTIDDVELKDWIALAEAFVGTLPPKSK